MSTKVVPLLKRKLPHPHQPSPGILSLSVDMDVRMTARLLIILTSIVHH